jgi:hypothetical protein
MKTNLVATILLAVFFLFILLSALDLITISFSIIVAYMLLIGGMVLVYNAIQKENKIETFIGTIFFLAGIFFLVSEYFDLRISGILVITALFLITGMGFFMIFFAGSGKRIQLYLSAALLAAGLITIITARQFKLTLLMNSFLPVLNYLWLPVIILVIILILMKKD